MQPTQNTAVLAEHPPTVLAVSPVATVDVATILRQAALYLVRYGWVQGAYYDASAVCFTPAACLVGAIGMVCYGGPVDAPAQHFDAPGFAEFEASVAYLDRYLAQVTPYEIEAYSFNDAMGRTLGQVVGTLHAAADELDAIHGGAA